MVDHPRWLVEAAWALRTGKPAGSIDDYHPVEALALLLHTDRFQVAVKARVTRQAVTKPWWEPNEVVEATAAQRRSPGQGRLRGPPKRGRYEDVVVTGDPIVDAWEAAIARGETPDLERRRV